MVTSSSSASCSVRAMCQSERMDSSIGRNCWRQSSSWMISKCQMVGARSTRGLSAGGKERLTGWPGTWVRLKYFSGWSLSE